MRTILIDNSLIPLFLRAGEKIARCLPEDVQRVHGKDSPLPTLLDFDRLIVSGSEASVFDGDDWIKRQADLISYAVLAGKPVLGVCFGHQLLARAMWGLESLAKHDDPEFGWYEIKMQTDHPLLDGLPTKAPWFCSHYDRVVAPPAGEAKVLAASKACPIHAYQVGDFPAFGVQFHPEYWGLHAHFMLKVMAVKDSALTIPTDPRPTAAEAANVARRLFANFWRYGQ